MVSMIKKEIQELKDTLWANTWSNEEIIDEGITTLKKSMEYKEEGFRRIESAGLLAIYTLQQENKQLKSQLEYLRSGEYLNQLTFERNMLQDLVDSGEISKENKEFIDMTHRNNELLEQLKQRDEVIDKVIEELEKGIRFCENDSQGIYDKCNIAIRREKNILEKLLKYKGDNK